MAQPTASRVTATRLVESQNHLLLQDVIVNIRLSCTGDPYWPIVVSAIGSVNLSGMHQGSGRWR
jgi:hypothetical protein